MRKASCSLIGSAARSSFLWTPSVIFQLTETEIERKLIMNPLTITEIETEIIVRTWTELEWKLKSKNEIRTWTEITSRTEMNSVL